MNEVAYEKHLQPAGYFVVTHSCIISLIFDGNPKRGRYFLMANTPIMQGLSALS